LIEWARRRRSYHYLGSHFGWAFIAGTVTGLCLRVVINYPPQLQYPEHHYLVLQIIVQAMLAALGIAWMSGAWYLASPMKRDADQMEFAWYLGCLYPDFKKKVLGDASENAAQRGAYGLKGAFEIKSEKTIDELLRCPR
jgi:hypothetical protein